VLFFFKCKALAFSLICRTACWDVASG